MTGAWFHYEGFVISVKSVLTGWLNFTYIGGDDDANYGNDDDDGIQTFKVFPTHCNEL